jgi:uncharacterized protein GlcG (DUF336 family)/catechol 2,3-dioxygenase-like lactoylglutathione lyase family enzyme
MIALQTLSFVDAQVGIDAINAFLRAEGKAAVAAVADQQGELIGLARFDGAPYPSILIAANKAWTAARERSSSLSVGQVSRARGGADIGGFGDPRYTGFGGGIPVVRDDSVVGAVAVSGLTTEDDIRFAQVGVDAIDAELDSRGRLRDAHPGLAHVALWTRDLDSAAKFWRRYFGATPSASYRSVRRLGFESIFVRLPQGPQIELMTGPWIGEGVKETERAGWAHVAISVGSKENVRSIAESLSEAGLLVSEPRLTGDGFYEALAKTPDGALVEVTI